MPGIGGKCGTVSELGVKVEKASYQKVGRVAKFVPMFKLVHVWKNKPYSKNTSKGTIKNGKEFYK